jgi:hypothetical protein
VEVGLGRFEVELQLVGWCPLAHRLSLVTFKMATRGICILAAASSEQDQILVLMDEVADGPMEHDLARRSSGGFVEWTPAAFAHRVEPFDLDDVHAAADLISLFVESSWRTRTSTRAGSP